MPRSLIGAAAAVAVIGAGVVSAVAGGGAAIERVSVGPAGKQANASTRGVAISGDGRYVAFGSRASNLVAGDDNRTADVFLFDRKRAKTSIISVGLRGAPSSGPSFNPSISADGRRVAFESSASNLVAGDHNRRRDVFVYDRKAGRTQRVSVSSAGKEADQKSLGVAISANGKFVAFNSFASNLIPGGRDDTNIYVRDLAAAKTTLVSVSADGGPTQFNYGPSISSDGSLVAFESGSPNLIVGDTNTEPDIFVRNVEAKTTTRVSVSASGQQGDGYSRRGALSANGNLVAFESVAGNLIDGAISQSGIFVKDLASGAVTRVPADVAGQPVGGALPRMSADGSRIVFQANDELLVPDNPPGDPDPHVFAYDRATGLTTRVDTAIGGARVSNFASSARVSADGRFVVFVSPARNIVRHDTNSVADAFVRGPLP